MYGVQTPVVSAPLTPKAPLNAYIWGRKFETYSEYNSVQYFDIIFVPCKFFSLNLSKHVRNWRDIATSTHEIAIFSKMNVSKSQTHVFWFWHIVIWVYLCRACVLLRNPVRKNNHFFGETIQCVAFVSTLRFALKWKYSTDKWRRTHTAQD